MTKKIIVIGGTGMLGRPVAQQLIKSGFDVTIFSTNQGEAKKKFPDAKIVVGNLNDVASLEKAFQGQDAVYLNLSIPATAKPTDWNAERDGMANVILAARKAGIKRIGYLAPLIMTYQEKNNPLWWVFESKQKAVEQIRTSGIPCFIFHASSFMENFTGSQRDGNKINLAGKSLVPMYYIAGEDYGKQVANAFKLESEKSKDYYIQGTEAMTADKAARIFVDNYKKESLKIAAAPLGLLSFIGLFKPELKYVVQLMKALNNNPEPFKARETWDELGKPAMTIKAFAQKFK